MDGLSILKEKSKIVKMVTDKIGEHGSCTVLQNNFRVGKLSDMVTSLALYPENFQSDESPESE
jgi:hypothetical protein